MSYLEVGAIDENASASCMKTVTPLTIQKRHLEMIKVILNIFILLCKPLQEFKAVSAPFLGPEIEEKLLKVHSYTQKAQCLEWNSIFGVRQMLYLKVLPLPVCVSSIIIIFFSFRDF